MADFISFLPADSVVGSKELKKLQRRKLSRQQQQVVPQASNGAAAGPSLQTTCSADTDPCTRIKAVVQSAQELPPAITPSTSAAGDASDRGSEDHESALSEPAHDVAVTAAGEVASCTPDDAGVSLSIDALALQSLPSSRRLGRGIPIGEAQLPQPSHEGDVDQSLPLASLGVEIGAASTASSAPEASPRRTVAREKRFVRLQAILTDLPKHGLRASSVPPEPHAAAAPAAASAEVQLLQPQPSTDGAPPATSKGKGKGKNKNKRRSSASVSKVGRTTDEPTPAAQIDVQEQHIVNHVRSNGLVAEASRVAVIQAALQQSSKRYPGYARDLGDLLVAHASVNSAIFVDVKGERAFTSVRGTDPFRPQDLRDDALIALGLPPRRVEEVLSEYVAVMARFPGFASYACGHSLGGAVLHEIALTLERRRPNFAFTRVDVFNPAGSPFNFGKTRKLRKTQFNVHRVASDMVSKFYKPPRGLARTIEHRANPAVGPHFLGHFLPKRRSRSV